MERVFAHHAGHVPSIPNLNPTELKALRQIFDSNGYADEPSMQENGEADILKMLFARDLPVDFDQARRTFHPLDLDKLIESGLLYEENHEIKAHFQAQPYSGLIFLSDFFKWESDRDFVLPIGPAGNYLALLTIRRQVESILDLGCGCGIQSLLAARHSDKVIATDINPRALALTRFNAELNDIHNIETRQGSYFEPVKGQCFDLIVGNLPYVISPESHFVYRDVNQPGNASIFQWLQELPAHLTDGGFAQVLINWVYRKDQDWSEPIYQFVEGMNVDTWLIHNNSKQPAEYAEMWIKHQTQDNPRKAQRTKQHWLRWYRKHNIERIALGTIALRRRNNAHNWFRTADINRTLEDAAGKQILRLFAAQDDLSRLEDADAVFDLKFKCIDLTTETVEDKLIAYSSKALHFKTEIHPVSAAILQRLDGKTYLKDAIEAACRESGLSTNEVTEEVLANIKTLMQFGMLALGD